MNTNDLTEKLPTTDTEKEFDTKPLLKEIREDLTRLMAGFQQLTDGQTRLTELVSQLAKAVAQIATAQTDLASAFAEERAKNEAFRTTVMERLDRIETKVEIVNSDHLELRTDMVYFKARMARLERAA